MKSQISDDEFLSMKMALEAGKALAFKIATGSMMPLIHPGDLVVLEKGDTPKIYDILVFRQNAILICHFIKHINSLFCENGNTIYVTGNLENLDGEDLPVSSQDVLGVVKSHRLPASTKARLIIRRVFRRT